MKKLFLIPLLWSGILFSQSTGDSLMFKQISDQILVKGEAYDDLRELTKGIGHRLSGSENYEKAVKWGENKLREAGAEKVYLQEVMVPWWERGKESFKIKTQAGAWESIPMLSLGNSHGTDGKNLTGEIITVSSFEDLDKLPESSVKGKIVFFNFSWPHEHIQPFQGYSETGKYRRSGASVAAKKGAAAVFIRSLSTGVDDVPHTGSLSYEEGVKVIPAFAIGNKSADRIAVLSEKSKVEGLLNSNAKMKGEKKSYSVIGEIPGKKSSSVIVVAGHLDSWDVGEGAHDDGTGITQSIEVLRTFKNLGIQNNHTIRVVLYANEENGVKGGRKYLEEVKKNGEKHIFAIESDSGGFTPRGIALDMSEEKIKQVESWAPLFLPYGVYDFSNRHSGVDIGPLKQLGVPLAGLVPDPQRYFDLHHTPADTFETVNKRELLLGAITMAQIVYMIDKNWE